MNPLPDRSSIDHLRKQAKDLLRQCRSRDPAAFERLRKSLPAARGKDDASLAALRLRLHDAQSCIAREYGFASWADLKDHVEWQRVRTQDRAVARIHWLHLVYSGNITGTDFGARPTLAARLLAEQPGLVQGDPYLACAIGDEAAVRDAIAADVAWVNRSGGPLNLPPLIAVTHSSLARLDAFAVPMRRCLQLLIDAGADPNQSVNNRLPRFADQPDERVSAIYGAAGKVHDPVMTQILLAAGADPNDDESLYHSVEDPCKELSCTRLLLEAGARIEGTNAFGHMLDYDNVEGLKMLLAHGATPKNGLTGAIRHRRSVAHIRALLDAGVDPHLRTAEGESAYKLALIFGLVEVAELLRDVGAAEPISEEEHFVAACARLDEAEARRILKSRPDLPAALPPHLLRQMPKFAMSGYGEAVKLMVVLGWPIAIGCGGHFNASALNAAVHRGDASLTNFLLEHGASWRERHGYGSDVVGTLAWGSCNDGRPDADWLGCAQALVAHGLPRAQLPPDADPALPVRAIMIDGKLEEFSEEVTDFLLGNDSTHS